VNGPDAGAKQDSPVKAAILLLLLSTTIAGKFTGHPAIVVTPPLPTVTD
jgi:hypothetical protein